ncbi:cupin domain-containing protein [Kitasatospora sp. NPDC001664]
MTENHDVVLVRAAAAEVLTDAPGSLITLFADSATTGGKVTSNRATFEKGATGAPPHFHTRATEFFFGLDGELDVLLDDRIETLRQGDFLAVPAGTRHAFAPTAGSTADVLVLFTPGMDRFDYYRLLDRVNKGEASWQEIRESGEHYDNHYVESEVWQARTGR